MTLHFLKRMDYEENKRVPEGLNYEYLKSKNVIMCIYIMKKIAARQDP